MKFIAFAIISLMSLNVFANGGGGDWSERGNGGHVIVCEGSDEYIMLDLYEAHERYGFETTFPWIFAPGRNTFTVGPQELIMMAEDKLEAALSKHDPVLLEALKSILHQFNDEVSYLPGVGLDIIEDTGHFVKPINCHLEQLIVQQTPKGWNEKRYQVSLSLWAKIKTKSRLAAILHEVIYHLAITMNPGLYNSEQVRYFNALILSDQMQKLSKEEFQKLYFKVFMPSLLN